MKYCPHKVLYADKVIKWQGLFASDPSQVHLQEQHPAEDDLQVASKLYVDNAETTTAKTLMLVH